MATLQSEFELKFDKAETGLSKMIASINNAINGVKTDNLGTNISNSLQKTQLKVDLLKNKLETLSNSKIEIKDNTDIAKNKIALLQAKITDLQAKPTSLKIDANIQTAEAQITKLNNSIIRGATSSKKIDLDISSTQASIGKLESDIKSGITSGAKGGGLGIKREFTDLGITQLLKSQIIAGLAVQGISSAISGITSALKSGFEKGLNVETQFTSLKTIFKGVEKDAKNASKEINKFATETPYSVSQVTDAYIKLKNYGLDSSEKALRSFGNTASALGKPLNQMVEAVADASTGQFERLKEFGIKSQVEGDKVKFTFDGVTTTVGKNSKEITDYLTTIGETKFAGGMEAQSKTLSGTLNTLGDSFDTVLYKILGVEDGIVIEGGVFDQLRNGASFLLKTLSDPVFLSSVDNVAKGIISGFGSAFNFISKIDFGSLVVQGQNILTGLQPVFRTLQDLIFGAFNKIKNINFGDLGTKLTNIFGKIDIAGITSIFDKIKTSVTNALGKIDLNKSIEGLTTFATGVVDLGTKIAGSEIFKATVGTAIDLLATAFDKLTQIDTTLFSTALKTLGEGLTAISQNQLAVDIITTLGIALGGLAIIGTIAGWVTGLGAGFVALTAGIPALVAGFVAFFAPVTAGFGLIVGVVGTVFTAITGFVAFVGLMPILIGLAVAGIVLAFVLNFELIKTVTGDFFNWLGAKFNEGLAFITTGTQNNITQIGTFFTNLGTSITTTISSLWNTAGAIWNAGINFIYTAIVNFGINAYQTWQNLGNNIRNAITFLWEGAKSLFSLGVSALQNYITNFIPNVTNNFNNLKNTVINTVSGLWESAKSKFTEGVNGIKTTVEGMVTGVKEKFNQLKDGATTAITNMVDGAKKTLSNLPEAFTKAANDAKENLLGILRNIKLPELKFPEIKLPKIPSFGGENNYTGTNFWKGGVTEIAERGRELFKTPNGMMGMADTRGFMNLPKGTKIWNNAETEAIMNPNSNLDLASATRPQPRANNVSTTSNVANNTTNNSQTVNNYSSSNTIFGGAIQKLGFNS